MKRAGWIGLVLMVVLVFPVFSARAAEPDAADYQIVFRDSYSDQFYLNPCPNSGTLPSGFYGYNGVFVHSGVQYKATAIYDKSVGSVAVSLFYYDGQVMLYNVHYKSDAYYVGTYTWLKADYAYMYKQRKMNISLTKGSFPECTSCKKDQSGYY